MIIDKETLKHNAILHYDLVLDYLGIEEYKELGNQIRSNCPCHNGDNRSAFVLYLDTGQWFCYTHHCEKTHGSDIIGLIMLIKSCSYNQALSTISSLLQGEHLERFSRKKPKIDYVAQHLLQPKVGNRILNRLEKNYRYIMRRGMDPNVFKKWQCGVAHHGKMRGRFVIPIRDINGDIVGFSGRNLTNSDKYPKWLHSKFRKSLNLFNIEEVSGNGVFLVEGPFDVAKGKMCGIDNICATLGTSLSQGQIELLKYLRINRVNIVMDGDEAGRNAAKDMSENLTKNKIECINVKIKDDFGSMNCQDIRRACNEAIRS